ncbi:MAG TPA: hypothetical protein EYN28_07740 [Flavobacteriales bacterium]|nr:hypothetical protein [Flavobacteriales bacterium]HIB76272.1 hypothetical protein [Flavobacteriales bacterium]HIO16557.1 hypothetical protein [Flavobacteriales bacterium]HIO60052.1 hypothetical protein [Flavobacteriales bacterium]
MQAPKLKGMFRNVRTTPRSFVFKSRHLSDDRPDWDERKRRIEQEIAKENGDVSPDIDGPSKIRFSRNSRSNSIKTSARKANLRVVLIGVVLLFVTYRILVWAEETEFGKMLEFIRDNG